VKIKGYVDRCGDEAIEGGIYNAAAPQTRIALDLLAAAWRHADHTGANGQNVGRGGVLNGAILFTDMSGQFGQNLWMVSSNRAHG
jgi:hypothetical protein